MARNSPSSYFHHKCSTTALPTLFDELGTLFPTHPYLSLPLNDACISDGFRDISFSAFAQAVNRAAWWLRQNLGSTQEQSTALFTPIHYVGPQDLRYLVLLLAAVKSGFQLIMCHPAVSSATHVHLLTKTNCTILLYSSSRPSKVDEIVKERQMEMLEAPELEDWLRSDEEVGTTTEPFPYTKSFTDSYNDPFVVLHSSGTTGPPKPITVTHGCVNQQIVSFSKIQDTTALEYEKWRGQRWAMLTPITIAAAPYHIFGINILFGMTSVLPPPVPITADIFDQVIVHGNATCCLAPPRVLPETAENPAYLNNLRRLKGMSYIGAPVLQHVGRKLAPYAKPISEYGSSEATIFPFEITDDEDWEYMKFHPIMPHTFRHVCHDNYELVILRDDKLDACQGAFRTFPDMQEYGMKDLFAPHPTKAGLWTYRGRTDDLIVAATGETFLPNPMEQIIETHPAVGAALICPQNGGSGEGLALIVETRERLSETAKKTLLEDVWPLVENANTECPIGAKIKRELILFVGDEKPMPRGTKGFAQRAKALAFYHPDITAVFQKEGAENHGNGPTKKRFGRVPARLSFLIHKLPWSSNGLV